MSGNSAPLDVDGANSDSSNDDAVLCRVLAKKLRSGRKLLIQRTSDEKDVFFQPLKKEEVVRNLVRGGRLTEALFQFPFFIETLIGSSAIRPNL